ARPPNPFSHRGSRRFRGSTKPAFRTIRALRAIRGQNRSEDPPAPRTRSAVSEPDLPTHFFTADLADSADQQSPLSGPSAHFAPSAVKTGLKILPLRGLNPRFPSPTSQPIFSPRISPIPRINKARFPDHPRTPRHPRSKPV